MTAITATAPGKVILFGEHAVVYGRPALAAPVSGVRATARVEGRPPGSGTLINAADLNLTLSLTEAAGHALALTLKLVLKHLQMDEPDVLITLRSAIPIAGGLGSGAAISAALARAVCAYLGRPIDDAALSALVYEVEKVHHGTPSGIDNTVICYGKPVYFVKGSHPQIIHVGRAFELLIGDTGIAAPTRTTVATVREGWQRDPHNYETLFDRIGQIARKARGAVESGAIGQIGPLMNENHALLRSLGVSSEELERLVEAALGAGSPGAKLSGGGGGGNMIALVEPEQAASVREALIRAGAARVLHTTVQ